MLGCVFQVVPPRRSTDSRHGERSSLVRTPLSSEDVSKVGIDNLGWQDGTWMRERIGQALVNLGDLRLRKRRRASRATQFGVPKFHGSRMVALRSNERQRYHRSVGSANYQTSMDSPRGGSEVPISRADQRRPCPLDPVPFAWPRI